MVALEIINFEVFDQISGDVKDIFSVHYVLVNFHVYFFFADADGRLEIGFEKVYEIGSVGRGRIN